MKDSDDPGHPDYWRHLLEPSVSFEAGPVDRPSLDTLRSLYSQVLLAYGYVCALTGKAFDPPRDFLHDRLEIVPIQPLTMGGALHVDNFLCLSRHAAEAFRAGHIGVGPHFELIADLSRIDPELLETLNPTGYLGRPNDTHRQPDLQAFAFHREHIFLVRH